MRLLARRSRPRHGGRSLAFPRRGWAALTDCPSPFCNFLSYARSLGRVIPLLTFCHQSTSCTVVNSREWNDSHSTPDNPYHVNKDRDISAIRTDNQASAEDLWLPAGLLENPLRLWKGEPAKGRLRLVIAGVFQEAAGAGGVVDAAGAEASEGGNSLVRSAAAFADHVEHLASHVEGHHAVAAHRG